MRLENKCQVRSGSVAGCQRHESGCARDLTEAQEKKRKLVEQPLLGKSGQHPPSCARSQTPGPGRKWDVFFCRSFSSLAVLTCHGRMVPGNLLSRAGCLSLRGIAGCECAILSISEGCKLLNEQKRRGDVSRVRPDFSPAECWSGLSADPQSSPARLMSGQVSAAPITHGLLLTPIPQLHHSEEQRPAGTVGSLWIQGRTQKEDSGKRFLTRRSLPAPIRFRVWMTVSVLWWPYFGLSRSKASCQR